MTSTGLISQFDPNDGTGHIMFSDGEKFEFTLQEWKDREQAPMVGLKVAFSIHKGLAHIKIAAMDDEITESPDAALLEQHSENDPFEEAQSNADLKSIDDFIQHYSPKGFKIARDTSNGLARTVSLRLFTPSEFAEIMITQTGDKISASYTLNGQSVPSI
jgi:hypothetical protein